MNHITLVAVLLCSVFVTGQVAAEPEPGYYFRVDKSSQQAMRDSLHEIIDDHTRFPYTSTATDTWDVLEIADEDQDNSNNIITVYRNVSYVKPAIELPTPQKTC